MDAINAAAQIWFHYMLSASVQATLLALVLLGIVWAGRRLSPALHHALLMVALLKFVIPPTLPLPTGLFSQIKPDVSRQSAPAIRQVAPVVENALWLSEDVPFVSVPMPAAKPGIATRPLPAPTASMPSADRHTLTAKAWLMMIHLLGALLILALALYQRIRLRKLAGDATSADDPDLLATHDELCESMRLLRRPRLLLSNRNHAPMTFGTWKPVIVLSQDLVASLPQSEIRVILGHELAHQRRWDLWLNWLQVPISAIWWFNPVYWLLANRIRSVREDCCDDLVVASGFASGESYCETLLQAARVASGKLVSGAALAYIGESQPLRRRFRRIMSKKLITAPRLAWTGIVIVILLALLFLPGIRKRPTRQGPIAPARGEAASPSAPNAHASMPANPSALNPVAKPYPGEPQGRVILFRVIEAATGQGIENAALLIGPYSAMKEMRVADAPHTDADGRCSIPAPAPPVSVVVRADTYVSRRLSISKAEDCPDEYTFKLEKGSFLGGYVHDESGKPIADVRLTIISSNTAFEANSRSSDHEDLDRLVYTRTDASGRWTVNEILPDPEEVSLTLDHPDYGTTEFTTRAGVDSSPFSSKVIRPIAPASLAELKEGKAVLVMESGLVVAGTVLDESSRGIGGAEIRQFEKNPFGGVYFLPRSSAKTEVDGRFAFRSLKPGEIVIAVQAKGFAPEYRTIAVARHLPEIEFRLRKGEIVSGRVVDDSGNPVAGATIQTVGAGADQPISWQGKTDADGRFLWDSAPAKALSYDVSAQGYKPTDSVLLDSSSEHEIRLIKGTEILVSGKVFDSKTKMPLDSFKVSALFNPSPTPTKSVDGKNGEFTLTLPVTRAGTSYTLLVEAAGYIPDGSQSVDDKESTRNLEIALVRGGGYEGKVTLPDGNPVPGANVFLCGGNLAMAGMPVVPTMMSSIRTIVCSNGSRDFFTSVAVTDDSGKFSLIPVAQGHSVYATHEKGFAAITPEKLATSSSIVLQPWGKVEGTLMIGSKAGVAQNIFLSQLTMSVRPPALNVTFNAVTDNEGKFVFPTLPPGEYRVSHRLAIGASGQFAFVTVRSGETSSIKIGGTGQPVIGRILVTGTDETAVFKIRSASLALKLPGEAIPRPADAAAYRDWIERDDVRERTRSERNYSLRLDPDGSFRVEDMLAGTYILTVAADPSDAPGALPSRSGERFTSEIVVPEMPGGRGDTPLDLGVIRFQSAKK